MKAVLKCSGEWFSPLIEEAIFDINKSAGAGLADDKARHQIREIMEARIGIATHDFFCMNWRSYAWSLIPSLNLTLPLSLRMR